MTNNAQEVFDVLKGDLEPFDNWYTDLFPLEEWNRAIRSHAITPNDGNGYWATETKMSMYDCFDPNPDPERFTHVVWFNN